MRIFLPAVSSVMAAVLAGCASSSQSLPPAGSTQGSTLVQKAHVIDVRDIAGRQVGNAGSAKRPTILTVRSDDGDVTTHDVESSEIFRVGEPVNVITANGNVRITH